MAFLVNLVWGAPAEILPEFSETILSAFPNYLAPPDSSDGDTSRIKLKYPIRDRKPYERTSSRNPFDLGEPSAVKNKYVLDPETNSYNYSSTIGNQPYRLPATVSIKDKLKEDSKQGNESYFRQRAQANNFASGSGIIPPLKLGPKVFERIFGSGIVDIRPRGTAELIFQGLFNTVRNPAFPPQQQTTGQFDFRQKIQLNVQGSIGDKLKVNINYDTEATFDFENQVKLDYSGKDDDILKKIELGNVSLPLTSSLIQGSQSLFGVKTEMQFGKLKVTSIFTQQRGKTTETEITGGAQTSKFDIQSDNYDYNRHYFLGQYFRDHYDEWMRGLPIVGSPVIINRVEVWVTNRSGSFDGSRDVIGFEDLGETDKRDNKNWVVNPAYDGPENRANSLFPYLLGKGINQDSARLRASSTIQNELIRNQSATGLQPITQFQMISYARLLNQNDFSFNSRLGYISLNQTLNNDDVLCVAYEYTLNGKTYRVGEFTSEIPQNQNTPNVLFLKMLKGPSLRPDLPIWDLMMKNVYSLGTYGIQTKDFKLSIVYADDPSGADLNYIPIQGEPGLTGKPLIQVMNLDNVNTQQEKAPDGLFDFYEGLTINSQQGRIFFPVVEPFGSYLQSRFQVNAAKARYYCFFELYDSTRFAASQLPQYNKFFLRGTFQGQSSSEVSLNSTNIPRGSVRVTANGAPLTENIDYTVDYNIGRVKILNTSLLNSGAVIKVSSESNSLFSVQQKTLMGTRLDYKLSNDILLGGTLLYLNERPLTPKVNLGEEPISNVMIGLDGSYKSESRVLTKIVDRIPFIDTKEKSQVTVAGEYAHLFPGVQSSLAQSGTAYLDDFENSESQIDLRMGNNWVLASTPQGQPDRFPEGNFLDNLAYGYRRANLAWYSIATTFYAKNSFTPQHIQDDNNMLSDHRMRQVDVSEIYPNRQLQAGMPTNIPTFDLAYFPKERGPYNYNSNPTEVSAGDTLLKPTENWAGIMRKIDNNDFEASNIDYIELWIMDPFLSTPYTSNSGKLIINLGNISEDILHDGRKSAENGIPKSDNPADHFVDTTAWARVPRTPVINFAFDADPDARAKQDVGLDGFSDDGERTVYNSPYLAQLAANFGPNSPVYNKASNDPSSDNYHYYLGDDYDVQLLNIIDRYKKYNRHQGNSPTTSDPPTSATNSPDNEDVNRDYTLNDIEEYFQYEVDIAKDRLVIGQNFVTDSVRRSRKLDNGKVEDVTWYQLKIPIREYQRRVGEIMDFKSIRFMRVLMTGFENEQVLRFGSLQLVRADWRKYIGSLEVGKEGKPNDAGDDTRFIVSTVNVEKNPAYKLPPGIQREVDFSTPQSIQQNEQSLSVQVCDLNDGDARAVFKNTQVDLRQYGKLRMFIHAQAEGQVLNDGDLTAFIRLGTDLTNNYYELEIPLQVSTSSATDVAIWPNANQIVLTLEDFIDAKIDRTNANFPFTAPYYKQTASGKITVIGLPDLSNVKVMMLGVRNPKAKPGSGDDALPKCAQVWFNELRMTEFNNRGGWAATGRMQAQLADFGNMQIAGNLSTVGFGGIDKKIQERNMDDKYQYDIQSSFQLGKFFPKKTGLQIPLFLSYGNTIVRPYYNPLNPDTRLQKEIDQTTDEVRKDNISRAADDFTMRKSLNLTNVRKERVNKTKNHVYDIENFSATYSYSETYRRNQTMSYYILQNYMGMVAYTYNFGAKPWEPFKKVNSRFLTLIKDFNVYYKPQSWGARVQLDRRYGVTINRNNDNVLTIIEPLYDKMYTMTRNYEFAYDFSRGLKFNYNATAIARIDEPLGQIDESTPQKRDTIWENLKKGGRLMQFDQSVRMNYDIPIKKLPYLDWITQSSYNYQANYQWKQAPPAADSLGNTISNSRTESFNLSLSFISLYNKSQFLQRVNNTGRGRQTPGGVSRGDANNTTKGALPAYVTIPFKLLTAVKNARGTYTKTESTTLPGFNPKPKYLGQNFDEQAPGFDFILALQDPDYRYKAARNGWISNDYRITNSFLHSTSENITGNITLEPISDLRIETNLMRNRTMTTSVVFRFDSATQEFKDVNQPNEIGSYSISYNIFMTTFDKESGGTTEAFQAFSENRKIISQRLAEDPNYPGGATNDDGYRAGYSRASQHVLIPAFLAAYSGKDANSIATTAFPNMPELNWRITYSGLGKMDWVKDWASNIQFSNAYSSTYNVSSFQSILQDDSSNTNTFTGDYVPHLQIKMISISERWGPFIGVEVIFINNLNIKVEYKRDRTLNFSLANLQLTEMKGDEISINTGYKKSGLMLPFKGAGGRRLVFENEINFSLQFSVKEVVTNIRALDSPQSEPVQGQIIYTLRPTIDYMISKQLMLRIFYDYRQTDPKVSSSYPTIIQSGGFSLRYTIQ